MTNSSRAYAVSLLLSLVSTAAASEAQQPDDSRPTVATSAFGEVRLPAELARVKIGVEFQDRTAARAAAEAAQVLARVLKAMEGLGFDRKSMPTTGYSVAPVMDWETDKVTGYGATTSVEVTLEDLTRLGSVIDAALAAGANDVASVQYDVKDRRAARDEAIRAAFAVAKRDAEVLSLASSGRLGNLIELSLGGQRGGMMQEAITVTAEAAGPRTTITAPEVVVGVTVNARWELVPTGR